MVQTSFSTLQYYNRIFNIHYNINTTIFFLKSFNTIIWDSFFFFTHPTSPAAPTSDKQFSKVFLKVVYLVVETFIWKSCVLGNKMPVLIHMRITRWFHKVHSLYKDLKNNKRVWRGGGGGGRWTPIFAFSPKLVFFSEHLFFFLSICNKLKNIIK